jgi:hypothetical protein
MRLPTTHDLKTIPPYFDEVLSRRKKFEVRKNDRDFQVNDYLVLREYDGGKYTGNSVGAYVTDVLHGPAFGIEEGYVVMSIEVV